MPYRRRSGVNGGVNGGVKAPDAAGGRMPPSARAVSLPAHLQLEHELEREEGVVLDVAHQLEQGGGLVVCRVDLRRLHLGGGRR
eukprot:scaffold5232_cov68-Isochrysis_galbana.AAC.1